jgi:hypothetical protein
VYHCDFTTTTTVCSVTHASRALAACLLVVSWVTVQLQLLL